MSGARFVREGPGARSIAKQLQMTGRIGDVAEIPPNKIPPTTIIH
jgi:hypothetical protein